MAPKKSASRMERAVSAGGVVYRTGKKGVEIVLCGRSSEGLWALPKGTPEPDESLEDAALREVEEETGLQVAIEKEIASIRYKFTGANGTLYDKRVLHHLMSAVAGSTSRHDGEFDEVKWFPAGEALRLLTYPNERETVRRAVRLIEQQKS